MEKLRRIGINPDNFNQITSMNRQQIEVLEDQIKAVTSGSFDEYWSEGRQRRVEDSGIFEHMAETVWKAASILGIKTQPKLGLFNGFQIGLLEHEGYCWEDDQGNTWVGLDELWFGDVCDDIYVANNIPKASKVYISLKLAEEVFHAYIREVNPELAEENILLNKSDNPEDYWNSPVEQAAKEFALWFVIQTSLESSFIG